MHDGHMPLFDRRPALRWLVPGATVAVIAAGTLVGTASVSADAGLEPLTPAQLLVALQEAPTPALSGTVQVTTDLGLPELPRSMAPAGTDPTALIGGTHTLRVWADGPERARLAILGEGEEYDVVRNGDQVWTWTSADTTATRYTIPAKTGDSPLPTAMPTTPQEAADLALNALDDATDIAVAGVASVAGRPVYELILTPQDPQTRIARVAIAVDAETKTPLRVQVFSTQVSDPAIEVGFTSVDFARPDPSVFAFTPPSSATVIERDGTAPDEGKADLLGADLAKPTMVGSGWSQIVVAEMPADATSDQAAAMLSILPATSGPWGTGRVIDGTLVSAVITDDGRVALGAVSPAALSAALAAE